MSKIVKINKESTSFKEGQNVINSSGFGISKIMESKSFAIFSICFLGIILYSNSFDCGFQLDDMANIVRNKNIRDIKDVQGIWANHQSRFFAFYTFALNYNLNEYSVWGYHLFNLLVHLINALIIYFLTISIFNTPALQSNTISSQKRKIALCTALIFVAHPLATNSVTYIVQRLASLVTMFYLLSTIFYILGRLAQTNGKRILYFSGLVLSAFAAIHTKENAYSLPIAILLCEFTLFQQKKLSLRSNNYVLWISFVIVILLLIVGVTQFSSSIFNSIPPSLSNSFTITPLNYLLTQFSVIVKYIQLLLFPIHQNLDYDYRLSSGFFELRTFLSFLFLLFILVLGVIQYNRNRLITFCIGWFFITLSIESSIVPIADLIFEHRTYLPSFGFFLLMSFLLFRYFGETKQKALLIVCLTLIASYGYATIQRNKVWKDEITMLQDIVSQKPDKPRPYVNLGMQYFQLNQFDSAMYYNRKALDVDSQYFSAMYNIANCFIYFNQLDSALYYLNKSIKGDSNFARSYMMRGYCYAGMNRWNEAIQEYNTALGKDSTDRKIYINRGKAYIQTHEFERAVSDYSRGIQMDSTNSRDYFDRGFCYANLKLFDQCLKDFSQSISLNPNDPEVYFNRGVTYANLKIFDKALQDFEKTILLAPTNQAAIQFKAKMEDEINKGRK